MRTMGWQDGQGLGKEGTGITEAIQVKQKEDTVGVRRPPPPLNARCFLLLSAMHPVHTTHVCTAVNALQVLAVQVGGKGGYAWGDKWWEKAFDSAVMTVDETSSSDSSDSDSGALILMAHQGSTSLADNSFLAAAGLSFIDATTASQPVNPPLTQSFTMPCPAAPALHLQTMNEWRQLPRPSTTTALAPAPL